jgi:hypothetical protein
MLQCSTTLWRTPKTSAVRIGIRPRILAGRDEMRPTGITRSVHRSMNCSRETARFANTTQRWMDG